MSNMNGPKADILALDVSRLFKESYKRGPWPTPSQCYGVAVAINHIRILKKKRSPALGDDRASYRKSRKVVAATRELISERRAALSQFVDKFDLRLPSMTKEIRNLDALAVALDAAEEALYARDPRVSERKSADWHKPARILAEKVEEALQSRGITETSREKGTPFITVIMKLLDLAGIPKSDGAIANALKSPS